MGIGLSDGRYFEDELEMERELHEEKKMAGFFDKPKVPAVSKPEMVKPIEPQKRLNDSFEDIQFMEDSYFQRYLERKNRRSDMGEFQVASADNKRISDVGKPLLETGGGGGTAGSGGSRVIADPPATPKAYQIIEKRSGNVIGTYNVSSPERARTVRKTVRTKIDKLDNEYGAYGYTMRPVYE